MYFGLHTTLKKERDLLLERGEYELIEISPYDIHGNKQNKPIVCEEDTGRYYEHQIKSFLQTLKMIESGPINPALTPYVIDWGYKGLEPLTRITRLPELFKSIKAEGIKNPVDIEMTGERLDGSFRSKIALYLGIEKISARLHRFKWQDINEAFIKRKLNARWLSSGKDYYEFDYGNGLKNIPKGGPVYCENAKDRWDVLKDYITGKVLDLGCNEGYMSIQAAIKGCEVIGYDLDWIHIANLNRLIFEWVRKEDLKCKFIDRDIRQADTDGFNTTLLLNVIYHLPREAQIPLLKRLTGRIIAQCNLRKINDRDIYYGSHPDDMRQLFEEAGKKKVEEINWRDKPILIYE